MRGSLGRIHRWWKDTYHIALEQGWTVEQTRGHHLKWTNPQGDFYFTASSPSDYRGVKNAQQQLKRRGLKI